MADQPPAAAAGRVQPLPIAVALSDRGCADAIAIVVSNLPPGAALSAGTDNGDCSWTLAAADLDGLAITPPADGFGDVSLTVSATMRDPADAGAPPTTIAFGLPVAFGPPPAAVAGEPPEPPQPPEPMAAEAVADTGAGGGERTVALDIDIGLGADDAPGPISVAIGGIPAGATLSAGADAGDGTWVLDATALAELALTLPADAPDRLTLGIAATAADGTSTAGVLSLIVSELPDAAPEPPALPAEPETESESETVFTPEFIPEFVTDYESAESPLPSPRDVDAPPGARVPIAYWKLDEQQPGSVGDEMAGHHGRSLGVADGASGGAFDTVDTFDGIDDYIAVAHAADLEPVAGSLTVWFNAFAGGQATIAAKGAPAAGACLALAIAGRRLRFVLGDGAAVHVAQGGAFGATVWNQATVTWGAAGMALYLNGELEAADDYADGFAGNDAPWLFGAADDGKGGVGDFFHGELDDIALYAEQLDAATVRRLFEVGVIGLMHDEAAATGEPGVAAGGDSGLDLAAIPVEADGPASLAVLDSETDDDEEKPAAADAVEAGAAVGDSALDLDAIPVEAEGPASLATLDSADEEIEGATAAAPAPAEADDDGVFVFGAGGDYFQGGDGWSDKVRRPPATDAPAVAIADDGELTLTGGDKLEW